MRIHRKDVLSKTFPVCIKKSGLISPLCFCQIVIRFAFAISLCWYDHMKVGDTLFVKAIEEFISIIFQE